MRTPEFSAYVSPARTNPEIWRLLLGLALIGFSWLGFFAIMLVVLYPITGPLDYFGWLLKLRHPSEPGQVIFILISFAGMFLGPIIAAPACHGRSPGTLFGPLGDTLRGFGLTLAVLVPVYAVALGVGWIISPGMVANLPLARWLPLLPLALVLVLVQTSAEELLFRGYLQQQLAARFAARWIWMGLPALLFTAGHWSPGAGATNAPILVVIAVFALISADLTEQTGSLGASIGLHFINNAVSILLVSVNGTITGLSLFVTPYQLSDARPLLSGLGVDLVMLFVIWRLLRRIVCR